MKIGAKERAQLRALESCIEQAHGYLADAMNQPGESYSPIAATYVREGIPTAGAMVLIDTAVTAIAFAIMDRAAQEQSA